MHKWIVHDWDHEASITILGSCRRAMRPGGCVVIIKLQLGRMDDPGLASIMDLNMMVMLAGRERTIDQYNTFFTAAGLYLARMSTLQIAIGPWSVIEAVAQATN